jgi:transcriptional regulator with XRE-family HTH domain
MRPRLNTRLSQICREFTAKHGLTDAEFAARCGVHPSGLCRWLSGEVPSPREGTLRKIARGLTISLPALRARLAGVQVAAPDGAPVAVLAVGVKDTAAALAAPLRTVAWLGEPVGLSACLVERALAGVAVGDVAVVRWLPLKEAGSLWLRPRSLLWVDWVQAPTGWVKAGLAQWDGQGRLTDGASVTRWNKRRRGLVARVGQVVGTIRAWE